MGHPQYFKRDVRLVEAKIEECTKMVENLQSLENNRYLALVATNLEIASMWLKKVEDQTVENV